jgi:hypothetical protein
MTKLRLTFVAIEKGIWDTWPADRSCASLSRDLLGLERRIGKQVSLREDRKRHEQLVRRLLVLARDIRCQRPDLPSLELDVRCSQGYIQLTDIGATLTEANGVLALESSQEDQPDFFTRLVSAWKLAGGFFSGIVAVLCVLFRHPGDTTELITGAGRAKALVFSAGPDCDGLCELLSFLRLEILPFLAYRFDKRCLKRMADAARTVEKFIAEVRRDYSVVILIDHFPWQENGGAL